MLSSQVTLWLSTTNPQDQDSSSVSEWKGHLLSCPGQLKRDLTSLLDYVRHTIVAPILIFSSTPATILLRFGFHQTKYQLVFERFEVKVKILTISKKSILQRYISILHLVSKATFKFLVKRDLHSRCFFTFGVRQYYRKKKKSNISKVVSVVTSCYSAKSLIFQQELVGQGTRC